MASTVRHDYSSATFHGSGAQPSVGMLNSLVTMLLGPIVRRIVRFVMWCVEG
jgi:hypothetical protein